VEKRQQTGMVELFSFLLSYSDTKPHIYGRYNILYQTVYCRKYVWGPIPVISDFASGEGGQSAREGRGRRSKKRKSRWEPVEEDDTNNATETSAPGSSGKEIVLFPGEIVLSNGIKVVLPPALTGRHASGNVEIVKLHTELAEVERKLRSGVEIEDTRPEHERSPSPPPIYDSMGVRLNTREVRMREKLNEKRKSLIEKLIKEDPLFKPPSDYRPEKRVRKIPIPYKEYPDANFIGLIIGPRGNTQKRMQEETNTRIAIRGKGSIKEGASRAHKYSASDDEDLHVLIVGDRQEDVDKAAEMIEQLLVPVDEEMNEHKKAQLRELALINGTLKENFCHLCGETGHMQMECPQKQLEVYKLPDSIQAKVDEQYARDLARVNPEDAKKNEEEYKSFLESLGGVDPRAQVTTGMNFRSGKRQDTSDELKIWVGNLPFGMDDSGLQALFDPFGTVSLAQVKSDAGGDRCFGFVHFTEESMAQTAVQEMDGKYVHGRQIAVRRKGTDNGRGKQRRVDDHPECKMFVANIPQHIDSGMLHREFEKFGQVRSANIVTDRVTHMSKGFGFVVMGDQSQVVAAVAQMNGFQGFDPYGRPLLVRPADRRERTNNNGNMHDYRNQSMRGQSSGGYYGETPVQMPAVGGQPYSYNAQYQHDYYGSHHDGQAYSSGAQDLPPLPPDDDDVPPPPPPPDEEPPLPPDDE